MRTLPLYKDRRAVVETAAALPECNAACTRCRMYEGTRSVCLPADGVRIEAGVKGAVLVLSEYPTREEDDARRPMSSSANGQVRALVEGACSGPVVYAAALRCAPLKRTITARTVEACRPYLRGLIEEVRPSRILCIGRRAYQMALGVDADPLQLGRRSYGYLSTGVPVFMLPSAARVVPNRFLWARFKADVRWALTTDPPLPPWDGQIFQVETAADSEAACAALAATGFAFDTETSGLMGDSFFRVLCLAAVALNDTGNAWLWTAEALKDREILAPLRAILSDANIPKVGHNLKYDFEAVAHGLGMLDARGVLTVRGVGADTLLWVKTIDTECRGALELCDNHVGMGGHKGENAAALEIACATIGNARANVGQSSLLPDTRPAVAAAVANPETDAKRFAFALIPGEVLHRYCALDTVATARLHALYAPVVGGSKALALVSRELHIPPTAAVAQIEAWGMSADADTARAFGRLLRPIQEDTLRQVRALGCAADLASSQQLGRYLFSDLGLPVQGVTETGQPKVDNTSLAALKDKHPVVPLLMEHAKVTKLLSTYVAGLIPHIRADGRIRSSLNIAGARSGRLSSSQPNLQNIPSQGQWAKMAKSIFNAQPGHVLLQLDYSQLEVRVAAMLSGDPDLTQVYLDGVDVHRRTAARAFGVSESDVTKELRRNAKAVVFGVLYGKTPVSLSGDLGVSIDRAQDIYDTVLGVYGVLSQWMRSQVSYVEQHGRSWTYIPDATGVLHRARAREMWQIGDVNSKTRSRARNGAVNSPIQGSASDFMLRSLCRVVEWIVADGIPARVTNTVHDSLLVEVPFAWALEVAAVTRGIMEGWPSAGVPLVVDVDMGLSWGGLHKLGGITLVAAADRRGVSDADTIRLAQADPDLADEMGSDAGAWLTHVRKLGVMVAA